MTKSEFIHVIVRLLGVLLLAYAVWSFVGFMSGLALIPGTPASPRMTAAFVLDAILRITIEFGVGLYLIVDGRVLHGILNRENE